MNAKHKTFSNAIYTGAFFVLGGVALASSYSSGLISAQESSDQDTPAETEEASPWKPETLDTGVDLSKVKTAKVETPVEKPTAEEQGVQGRKVTTLPPAATERDEAHAGHDHADPGQADPTQSSQAAPRRAVGTYGGGAPDQKTLGEHPDSGFLFLKNDEAAHDFGDLNQGDKVIHDFELSVSGNGDVVVSQIRTSCGCTVAQTGLVGADGATTPYTMGTPLKPGSKLLVKAQLDTKKKRDKMRSVVTIMSDDPRGHMQLQLSANVVPFFEMKPSSLNFGTLKPNDVVTQEMTITSKRAEAFALDVNREALPPELVVEMIAVEPREDGRASTWTARVTLGPKIPEGPRRNYQVQFVSDQQLQNGKENEDGTPAMQSTLAYAVVSVLGPVSANPRYMSFGLMREGQQISRTVRIENNDDEFLIGAPTATLVGYNGPFSHPDEANIEIIEVTPGRAYDLKLTMTGPVGLLGTFRGKLVIDIGHPGKPSLELPFTGVVRTPTPSPRKAN